MLLQFLIEIARQKNRHPLPQIQAKSGLRLPPDRYCLTSTNYKVKAQKKVLLKIEYKIEIGYILESK